MIKLYPDHIYDSARIDIAVDILGKEFAKLAGAKTDKELAHWRSRMRDSFHGIDIVASPVHDFWCTFDLLPLVKTKRLCRFVTAENVAWKLEKRDINSLTLSWMPFVEKHRAEFGTGPWPILHLKEIFKQHPKLWEEASRVNKGNLAKYGFNHFDEPITLVELPDNKYLLDGNGRLYGALMAQKSEISCWVGCMSGKKPQNYWVSTGPLRDLCYQIIDNPEGSKIRDSALTLLTNCFDESTIAKTNYDVWIKGQFPQLDELLKVSNETPA